MTSVHRSVCAKIVVLGDAEAGKTSFCRSIQQAFPIEEDEAMATGTTSYFCEEYFFAHIVDRDAIARSFIDAADTKEFDLAAVTLQLIDQSGSDRESLQPIIFRKAAGIFVVLDALHFFQEFVQDMEGSGSRLQSRSRLTTPSGASISFSAHSAISATPYTWLDYAQENTMHWAQACYRESTFVREADVELLLPLIVVVARCDLLPQEHAFLFTNFAAQLRTALKQGPVRADDVCFVVSAGLSRNHHRQFPDGELTSFKKIGTKMTTLLRQRMLPLLLERGEADTILLHGMPGKRVPKKKEKCEC